MGKTSTSIAKISEDNDGDHSITCDCFYSWHISIFNVLVLGRFKSLRLSLSNFYRTFKSTQPTRFYTEYFINI